MARRVHADQMGFDFAEPAHAWQRPVEVVKAALVLPSPMLDEYGVFDFSPIQDVFRDARRAEVGWHEGYALCTQDLAEWHGGAPNEHGVYAGQEEVELARDGDAAAIAHLAVTGRGHWLCGYTLRSGTTGSSGPVSVWANTGGATRGAALRDFARRFRPWFNCESTSSPLNDSPKQRRGAARVAKQLEAFARAA